MEQVAKDKNVFGVVHNLDPRLLDSAVSHSVESGKNTGASLYDSQDVQANNHSNTLHQTVTTSYAIPPQGSTTTVIPTRPEISRLISGTHEDSHSNIDLLDNLVNCTQMDSAQTTVERPASVPYLYKTITYPERPLNATNLSTLTFPLRQGAVETLLDIELPMSGPSIGSSSTDLPCRWSGCNQSFADLMLLRHHVTETHVGRAKSVLNLQCSWNGCGKQFKKRDNITSHLHIHIPYFEHVCDYCGRKWQRHHDLNKHLKGRHGPIMKDGRKHWPVKLFTDPSSDRRIAVTAIGSFPLAEPLPDLPRGNFHYITNEQPIPAPPQVSTTQGDLTGRYLKFASPTIEQRSQTAGLQASTYFALRYTRLSKDCTPQPPTDGALLSHGPNHSAVTSMPSSNFGALDKNKVSRGVQTSQAENSTTTNNSMMEYSLPSGNPTHLDPSDLAIHGKRKASPNDTYLPLKRHHGSPMTAGPRAPPSPPLPGNDSSLHKSPKSLLPSLPYNLDSIRDAAYTYTAATHHDDSSTNQPPKNPEPIEAPPRIPKGCNTSSSPAVPVSNSPGELGISHAPTNSKKKTPLEREPAKASTLPPTDEQRVHLANSASRVGCDYFL